MKNKKLNGTLAWKHLEDIVVPRLRLSLTERVVYSHLLRHSRLEGRRRLHFSIRWLAASTCLSASPARKAVRRLAAKGAVRLIERNGGGHILEVLLPQEIRGAQRQPVVPVATDLEAMDFLQSKRLRDALYQREAGLCFYCLRHLTPRMRSLDHILPMARKGLNSYRNLVACCHECNAQKGEKRAADFLRRNYRQGRLNARELDSRLKALAAVVKGKRKPLVGRAQSRSTARKGVAPEGQFLTAANL